MNINPEATVEANEPVLFDQETHTYTYMGKPLKGVTGILARQGIAPDYTAFKANDIYNILHDAADYGTRVHDAVESYLGDSIHLSASASVLAAIQRYRDEVDIMMNAVHTEYLVSDYSVATRVDAVLDDHSLVEIKSSPILNELAVRWQLSIEAFLYEYQEGEKVPHLYCLQLNAATARVLEVERIPDGEVRRLLGAERGGLRYASPEYLPAAGIFTDIDLYSYVQANTQLMGTQCMKQDLKARVASLQRRLSDVENKEKTIQNDLKAMSEKILAYACENNIDRIPTMFGVFTVTGAQALMKTDTRAMLSGNPGLTAEFNRDPYKFFINHPDLVEKHSTRVIKMGELNFKPEGDFGYGELV